MGAAAFLVCAAASLSIVGSVHAQSPRVELDLSGTRIAYDTLAPLNAPSLAALTEWHRPSLFARVAGSLTGLEDAGWSVQGRGDLAGWLSPLGPGSTTRVEIGGALGGGRHSSGFDSFLARADARVHLRRRTSSAGTAAWAGAWLGASVATARNSFDSAAVTGLVPHVGGWVQGGAVRATLGYLHTVVSGDAYPEANLAFSLTRGPLDLTAYGGARASPHGTAAIDERWAGATAAYWITSHAAVVVSGGRYSSDVLQNLPGGEFVSVGLRLTPRRARPIPISAAAPLVYTSEQNTRGEISFAIDGASSVEIAGDWNGWLSEPLRRNAAGRWVVPAGLPPGVHRFNLRVDGNRWVVPDGVPAVDDGFGGRVGLLIVEM